MAQLRQANDYYDEIKRILEQAGPSWDHVGASTGWESLDELYRPVPGELTVITGQPGHGKSEFLLSLLINLAELHEWRFACACFEARRGSLLQQLFQKRMRKTVEELKTLGDSDHEFQWMNEHFTFFAEPFQETPLHELLHAATLKAQERKLHGLLLDPYNFIARPESAAKFASETQLASDQLTRIKQWGRDHHCHVWLVVHPNKAASWVNTARPQLYDCSGSAHFNNKCDVGLVVARQRQEDDDGDTGPSGFFTDIFVEKVRNRDAGRVGSATLSFNRGSRTFSDSTDMVEDMDEEAGDFLAAAMVRAAQHEGVAMR